ncbi:unnamed protein product [Allacma fusca]|uniref:Potassium channel domain-containing protein n=1 Tax=Allacma fusca TaxID=39272 RepID=A0A8J2PXT9_9HEXA|nr:unnamed protein product [Allacma fusca]
MTPLQWTLLCGFFTIYLLFGGTIFMVLEQHTEILNREELSTLRQDVQEILLRLDRDFYHNDTTPEVLDALRSAKEGVINRISAACGGTNFMDSSQSEVIKWNYYNSVFFAFTIVTTIGYGHLSPSTDWSRVFVIFYALIGIPINGILLQGLGEYFSKKLVNAHKKSKEKRYESKLTLTFDIIFYLIPGLVVFIIFPAGLFTLIENWTYMDSLYYAFVSLTTIGFGDYVAGMGDGHNVWLWLYKACIIVWILFGLGYLMMILGFITKGMTHKKVRIVIENRLNNFKTTKDKLSKDVEYMRRVINELYMMKIKPVFPEEDENEETNQYLKNIDKERTRSQPCLSQYQRNIRSLTHTPLGVRRAGKIQPNGKLEPGSLGRTLSETDLDLIDKHKTFEDAINKCVLPDELLAAVLNVLSQNVVQDVLEAVDELNEIEELEDEPIDAKNTVAIRKNDPEIGSGAPWILGMVSESDEEILITSADRDLEDDSLTNTLEEVVIHTNDDPTKPPSQNLIEKVNTVIRKISSGTRTPSEGPSRKVSRNESDRKRKKSGLDSTPASRKVSQNDPPDRRYLNSYDPHHSLGTSDWHHSHGQGHSSGRNSGTASPRLERSSELRRSGHYHPHHHLHHHPHPRKISEESNSSPRPLTVETTSLADFLRALDTVHHKLKHADPEKTGESDDETGDKSGSSPTIPKGRRRKVGVFNPGFSFVNHAFNPDSDETTVSPSTSGADSNKNETKA